MILTGNDEQNIATVKASLHAVFTIKDLGFARYFLGMEVARSTEGVLLNQRKYVVDLLTNSDFLNCKPALFPMQRNLHLSTDAGSILDDAESYRRLVGRLL